ATPAPHAPCRASFPGDRMPPFEECNVRVRPRTQGREAWSQPIGILRFTTPNGDLTHDPTDEVLLSGSLVRGFGTGAGPHRPEGRPIHPRRKDLDLHTIPNRNRQASR